MVTDAQVRKLFRELSCGTPLATAARRADMDDKTARKYKTLGTLPSANKTPRTYRTRTDPFAGVWDSIAARLANEPRLAAKTLFDWLKAQHPGRFNDTHRRTFERRVRQWKATHGAAHDVKFQQVHHAADLATSDFTSMNALAVTIQGRPFDHLVYHFVLSYSNWESITLCASESFEALADGLQNALWELGGTPQRHRSDSLSAAVNNLSAKREFHSRYRQLLEHYDLAGQRINVRAPHENGDNESAHGHFKTALDQALLMRGSRDFASTTEYVAFLRGLVATRNAGRGERLNEELAALRPLPAARIDSSLRVRCRVDSGSLIHIHRNTYSVHSRLIGEVVEARLFADRVEVWYADQLADTLPRLVGRDKHAVQYRHIIDSLVRKPGAFEHYRYREDLFPTSRFRLAFDRLVEEHGPKAGTKQYLRLLVHAARESEVSVDDALRVLLAGDGALSAEAVIASARRSSELPAATDVTVERPDLAAFDSLLTHTELSDEDGTTGEHAEGGRGRFNGTAGAGAPEGTEAADDPGALRGASGPGDRRGAELPAVPGGTDEPRVRGPHTGSHPAADAHLASAGGEIVGGVRVVARSGGGDASVPEPARRLVPLSARERAGFWETRFGENAHAVRAGGTVGAVRASCAVRDVQPVGSGSVGGQARPASGAADQEAVRIRGVDHRRPGLRAAEPGRDGSAVHAVGGAVRTRECVVDEQPTVLAVDADLQGSDDDRSGHRPPGASQRDRGAERAQLPTGNGSNRQEENRRASGRSREKVTHREREF
jgi:hypothetical protein